MQNEGGPIQTLLMVLNLLIIVGTNEIQKRFTSRFATSIQLTPDFPSYGRDGTVRDGNAAMA